MLRKLKLEDKTAARAADVEPKRPKFLMCIGTKQGRAGRPPSRPTCNRSHEPVKRTRKRNRSARDLPMVVPLGSDACAVLDRLQLRETKLEQLQRKEKPKTER